MARDLDIVSRRGRLTRSALTFWAFLDLRLPVRPDRPARRVQLQREPLRHVSDHRLDDQVVRPGLPRLPDPRRADDDDSDRLRSDGRQHDRRHRGRVPARALAAAVPQRHSHHARPADHDPRPADRDQPARALHERLPPDAVADDGGDRPERVHDAVCLTARRGAAAGVRLEPRAGRERPRREHVQAAALCRPAPACSRDPRRRALRLHALARRVHHHAVPDRQPQHAADLHLHAGEVRDHARGERARRAAPRRLALPDGAGLRAARESCRRALRLVPRRSAVG